MKFKNRDSETMLFRNTYIGGEIIKKSKDAIIMNVRRIVASRGEGPGCDKVGHTEASGKQAMSGFHHLHGYYMYVYLIIIHAPVQ